MNPIEEQRLIIEQLHRIVDGSRPANATSATCRFEYQTFEDGSISVEQSFEYTDGILTVSGALDRRLRVPVLSLVNELHEKMRAHTGGNWHAFVLTVREDGSVTTKFEYPGSQA